MELTSQQLDEKFKDMQDNLLLAIQDQGRLTVDIMRQEVQATVKRSEDKILEGVGEMFSNGINPQLDNHENRIVILEDRTTKIS